MEASMSGVLRVSEAASIALHTALLLASEPERTWSTGEVARRLGVSGAHLAKVLQRLTRVELVRSTRGPKGGFRLAKPARQIPLLTVYEAIEGPLGGRQCLLPKPVCKGCCILGGLLSEVNETVRDRLTNLNLQDAARSAAVSGRF
jgi:Rrf2 family protein